LINELPRLLSQVTTEQIIAAAGTLRPQRRATVEVQIANGGTSK
jgi:zinc protease